MNAMARSVLLGLLAWLAACSAGEQAAMPADSQPAASAADQAGLDSLRQLERTASAGELDRLPVWEGIAPEAVQPGVQRLLAEVEQKFAALEANPEPGWSALMEPLERLDQRLGHVMGAIGHLLNVKYSDELKAAHDEVRPGYVKLLNRMGQSRPIYDAMIALRDGEASATLNLAQRRILAESIRGMERAGILLDEAGQARYREIQQRLAQLGDDFGANLVKQEQAIRIEVADPERVAGVPEAVLALAAKAARESGADEGSGAEGSGADEDGAANEGGDAEAASAENGPWQFAVNGPNYVAIMEHGRSRGLREEFYRAYRSRGAVAQFDNRPLVEETLQLRQELATLLGFAHYAEFSVDDKMAPSVGAVWELFGKLEAAARPAAEREYAELLQFMADQGAPEAEDPQPWDIPFWSERLREARYDYDEERLRDFFQMPAVFDGLFALVQRLYGFELRRADGSAPVWDASVRFFELLKEGEVIAGFYVDPYARPGEKRGGAWMNTLVDRSRVLARSGQSSSLPVALFVMNARPPAEGEAALMSLGEVRTLFHEFGHAMQHMFTEVEDGGASGLNLVEWDAVELASQFNEYWMDHKPFLRGLTRHQETGETLDDETLNRIIGSRNFLAGNGTLRQLQFAKVDMTLHQEHGLPGAQDRETPFETEQRIALATTVTPRLEGETMLPSFGHLFSGGYAAGYYSYKWAEVLAADAFAAFREAGLDNDPALREVAARFRDTVLALGGSRPAGEVYRLFRGRDADPEALLIEQGLLVQEAP